ncbi:hypothetical protein NCCP1664_15710 [Zafaria cholistanensis]|uniref:Uncharacterized protein n=1 Tax=Zafaria cholistanensis TaxID=1682741 RepID=A0A5A7NQQ5_9MICC|nr:hypothetical protein [Zafaria cholistanensis]GER23075.1 hypothetical protein NCCP1664_15710 [Zafaria cholistanensis]
MRANQLAQELDTAHRHAISAASAGLQDPALGTERLTGPVVGRLADAAVTSATPFLRAPLLARISAVRLLHTPSAEDGDGKCPACQTPAPCATVRELSW